MPWISKKRKVINAQLEPGKIWPLTEAIALLKSVSSAKFPESVDISVNLGVDPRKSDQNVRGSVVLPKGTGRKVRVAVFTTPGNVDAAEKAGADVVGLDELAARVKEGQIDFDIVIATPDAMRVVGQLGQVLGPRGLMPNPKDGTVSTDVAAAVANAKAGQVRYRTDKGGVIHCSVGKLAFEASDIAENIVSVLACLKKAKPASSKGVYFKKMTVSTTMGPGLSVDIAGLAF